MVQKRSLLLPLVETAVMIGLSVALSRIYIFQMPQGGKVTAASMVPLLLVALRRGPGWGAAAGVIISLFHFAFNPEFYHPVQFLLDYPVAFGLMGLAGLARGRSVPVSAGLGSLALTGRFLAHLLSGVVFFGKYAPPGQNVWLYSAIYNGSYMLPELIISAILLAVLLPVLQRALPPIVRTQKSA